MSIVKDLFNKVENLTPLVTTFITNNFLINRVSSNMKKTGEFTNMQLIHFLLSLPSISTSPKDKRYHDVDVSVSDGLISFTADDKTATLMIEIENPEKEQLRVSLITDREEYLIVDLHGHIVENKDCTLMTNTFRENVTVVERNKTTGKERTVMSRVCIAKDHMYVTMINGLTIDELIDGKIETHKYSNGDWLSYLGNDKGIGFQANTTNERHEVYAMSSSSHLPRAFVTKDQETDKATYHCNFSWTTTDGLVAKCTINDNLVDLSTY